MVFVRRIYFVGKMEVERVRILDGELGEIEFLIFFFSDSILVFFFLVFLCVKLGC